MAKISISEAIRLSGISRSTFYNKYINTGKISVEVEDDKKQIDTSELTRVFKNIQIPTNVDDNKEHIRTSENSNQNNLIEMLKAQLTEAKNREINILTQSQEREQWLQKQIDELREQQNRLLENSSTKRKKLFGLF